MPDSERIQRIKEHAQLLIKAAEEVQSWDEDYKDAIIEVLEDQLVPPAKADRDFDTAPCPICGKPLTVERKPTLHYLYQHEGKKPPATWPPN